MFITNNNEIVLMALDIVEDLRQRSYEGPIDDYDYRVAAANIAQLFDDPELLNRAKWCDLLKEDSDSLYHKRYYHGVYHI